MDTIEVVRNALSNAHSTIHGQGGSVPAGGRGGNQMNRQTGPPSHSRQPTNGRSPRPR